MVFLNQIGESKELETPNFSTDLEQITSVLWDLKGLPTTQKSLSPLLVLSRSIKSTAWNLQVDKAL